MDRHVTLKKFKYTAFTTIFMCVFVFGGAPLPSRAESPSPSIDQIRAELKSEIMRELKTELYDEIYQKVYDQVYKDIYESINQDMYAMVQDQVKGEFQRYMARYDNFPSPEDLATLANAERMPDEQLDEAVRRIVKDIYAKNERLKMVPNPELDTYIAAGGIEADLSIAGGYSKTPQVDYQLAAADTDKKPQETAKPKKKEAKATETSKESSETTEARKRAASLERALRERGSILLPKNTLLFEASSTYAHFSSNNIHVDGILILDTIAIGEISAEKVKRDIFVQNFAFKYGLMSNLQGDIKIPFRGQHLRKVDTAGSEDTSHTSGLGDIEFNLSRQVGWESGWLPDLIASVGVKTPTGKEPYNKEIGLGTGHWSVKGSLIAAKSSDPAVVFGSLTYTYSIKKDGIENIGEFDPGNSIGYSLGTAIALSYQTAISFSFDQTIIFKSKANGEEINGSFLNSASFKTGFNWAINERSSVDFNIGIGLTPDSPDMTVELRFPYNF